MCATVCLLACALSSRLDAACNGAHGHPDGKGVAGKEGPPKPTLGIAEKADTPAGPTGRMPGVAGKEAGPTPRLLGNVGAPSRPSGFNCLLVFKLFCGGVASSSDACCSERFGCVCGVCCTIMPSSSDLVGMHAVVLSFTSKRHSEPTQRVRDL